MEKSNIIEKLFHYIDTFTYLILPLLFLFFNVKRKIGYIIAAYGLIFFALLFSFYALPITSKTIKLYNTTYTFLEYTTFALLFYINLKSKKSKVAIILLSISFYIFQILHFLFIRNIRMDSIPIGIESIIILAFVVLFFLEILLNPESGYIYYHYCFWISVGLLIFLSGNFFMNILAETLPRAELDKYWFINYITDAIKTVFFGISLYYYSLNVKISKKEKSSVPYLDMI